MRVPNPVTASGLFWLPSRDDRKLTGQLRVLDGGEVEVEVVGLFRDTVEKFAGEPITPRILGQIDTHELVTLDNCVCSTTFSTSGVHRTVARPELTLLGAAFGENEEIRYKTFSFSVDGLDEWHEISGIKVENDFTAESTVVSFNPPAEVPLWSDDSAALSLRFAWTLPLPHLTHATVSQKSYLRIEARDPQPCDYFTKIAYQLVNFFSLAVDATISLCEVVCTHPEVVGETGDGTKYEQRIRVFYKSWPFPDQKPKISAHEMLFKMTCLAGNPQSAFQAWFAAYERVMPSINLYFSAKAGAHRYLDSRFLALAQSLETFHRRTHIRTRMPDTEFAAAIQATLEGAPEKHREWIKARLEHGNEISLVDRLTELFGAFPIYFGDDAPRKKILRWIVDTRNYFTHWDPKRKERAAQGSDLLNLVNKMEVLLQLLFLREVGFSDSVIARAVARNRGMRWRLGCE